MNEYSLAKVQIFILIEQEYNNNFNRFRNNILNYNKY
jgi:hypothetical protein